MPTQQDTIITLYKYKIFFISIRRTTQNRNDRSHGESVTRHFILNTFQVPTVDRWPYDQFDERILKARERTCSVTGRSSAFFGHVASNEANV